MGSFKECSNLTKWTLHVACIDNLCFLQKKERPGGQEVYHKSAVCLVAKKAKQYPEEKHWQKIEGGDPAPLLYPVRPHLECCVHFWAPQLETDKKLQKWAKWGSTKMMMGQEYVS